DDDILLDYTGLGRGATRPNVLYLSPVGAAVGHRFRNAHAEVGVLDLLALDQHLGDLAGEVDRDRKAQPDRPTAAVARADRAVQPDHRTGRVHQRATGVAGVEGGVGLDGVDHRVGVRALSG